MTVILPWAVMMSLGGFSDSSAVIVWAALCRSRRLRTWDDAMDVASRFETHGQGGAIQIMRNTYDLVKDEFVCEPKGTIEIKGADRMSSGS
jgi:class 3 adenylate cyclase